MPTRWRCKREERGCNRIQRHDSWGPTQNLTGQDLGGKNLIPGVYNFNSSAQLTGALTLRGNGIYIFQIGSTLTTATNSVVNLTQGAQGCGVYWRVGSSATLGTGTRMVGTIIAMASITMVSGSTLLPGRATRTNGAVTLDSNHDHWCRAVTARGWDHERRADRRRASSDLPLVGPGPGRRHDQPRGRRVVRPPQAVARRDLSKRARR